MVKKPFSKPVTELDQKVLKQQTFGPRKPGTMLEDFQTLLDFVGSNQLKSGGKSGSLPINILVTLDGLMTQPLRPKLMRPQQLSFPHLNGLCLLLRTTGLGRIEGKGERARLAIDPVRLEKWQKLNAVERWFTLLQAAYEGVWQTVRSGESEVRGPAQEFNWFQSMGRLNDRGKTKPVFGSAADVIGSWHYQTTAALMELFGFLDIPRMEPKDGENWRVCTPCLNAFGNLIIEIALHEAMHIVLRRPSHNQDDSDQSDNWLGAVFRRFYPDCQHTLPGLGDGTAEDFVDGVWQLKVSVGESWRRLIVPADTSLEDLASGILAAFKFDEDHLYEFSFKGTHGRTIRVDTRDGDFFADEFDVGYLPLAAGDSFVFHFDFGYDWMFNIKVEKILPIDAKLPGPTVVAKEGRAPKQYRD